jgi:mRNA interferase RelE/StbE
VSRYEVKLKSRAARQIQKLEDRELDRALEKIDALGDLPRPPGAKKLQGAVNLWRIRSGDYRIIYTVNDETNVIEIVKVRHRSEAYSR